ncbi:MAG: hypothetical protein Q8M44_01060, partial [bacterium]|nr:hypothetical protein [bacterium]
STYSTLFKLFNVETTLFRSFIGLSKCTNQTFILSNISILDFQNDDKVFVILLVLSLDLVFLNFTISVSVE